MTLRVFFAQTPSVIDANTGIGRVVHAQHRYLPELGIEIVGSEAHADVTAAHANAENIGQLDVLHIHGLYWTGDPGSGTYHAYHHEINRRLAADCRRARAITVPSDWVAEPFRRDMRLSPDVIGHGLDLDEWGPGESQGYVLSNKNRNTDVCNPIAAHELAQRGVPVVSTFAPLGITALPPSLRVVGQKPHAEMKTLIQGAGVYLATTKETFGIGTLEALACGVPVLGYRWGGTADIIAHEQTGYLVQPGDVEGLLEGYAWLMRRRREISANCLEAARGFGWRRVMERYAELYRRVAQEKASEPTGVSVVITNYNYGTYVEEAIQSCLDQTRPPEEIIVIDDGSTDGSQERIKALFDREYDPTGIPQFTLGTQANRGVAAARNTGISLATQPHVVCLDADDRLDPRFIATLLPVMQTNRGLGIAYTGLAILRDGELAPNEGWPPAFDWDVQTTPTVPAGNCIPSACMFRREMWQRAGGYQQVWAPGEDGEFWTRGLSVGFEARQVTRAPLFHYRVHEGSASRTKTYQRIDTWHPWMRDRQYPFAAPARRAPPVRSYSEPLVSVVVTVGPGQTELLPATLDSLLGQTLRCWEAIAVNNDPAPFPRHAHYINDVYPFVYWVYGMNGDMGVNDLLEVKGMGLAAGVAPLALHLEAGEYLAPDHLETMIRAYAETGALEGGLEMGCRSCGSQASPQQQAQRALAEQVSQSVPTEAQATAAPGMVRMEFVGEQSGSIPFRSQDRQRIYYGGRRSARFADVDPRDVEWLMRAQQWQVVRRPEPPVVLPPEEVVPTVEGAVPYAEPETEPASAGKRRKGGSADPVK